MDEFFFDYGHDQESKPYALTNLRVGREWGPWSVVAVGAQPVRQGVLRARLLLRQRAAGFRRRTLYTRLGDPRHYGLTVSYEF